jgi:FkbM family methyltransferase
MSRVRASVLRTLGVHLDDSSSIPNHFFKRLLNVLGIKSSSKAFAILKKFYRKTGSHIRISKSYSFNGEDLILAKYLPELNGSYLDIGSGNATLGSNTFLFYKRGWSGITIDPLKRSLRTHQLKRKRDSQLLGVVTGSTDLNAKVIFYEYSADDYSTTSEGRYLELLKNGTKPINIREVNVIDLAQLNLSVEPSDPFLLDIDIEGDELAVLNSVNWTAFLPRVVAVEEWVSPIYVPTDIRLLLEEKGYVLASRAAITSIYVHENYLHRAE